MSFCNQDELQHGQRIIGRYDIIPTNEGYQFCELNVDSSLGGLKFFDCMAEYCDSIGWFTREKYNSPRKDVANYLRELVITHQFERVVIFSLKEYVEEGGGTVKCLFDSVATTIPEVPVLRLDEENYPVELLDNSIGKKTLIYRMAMYEDVACQDLLEKIMESGATIINSFETEIRSNKNWFAIFHEPFYQTLLTGTERAAMSKFVPYTIHLTPENINSVLEEKERFVFKANRSYGGVGVHIGANKDLDFLRKTLGDLKNWTAQTLVESEELFLPDDETFTIKPHKIVLGLFQVMDKYSGIVVRASMNNRIVNVTYGAKIGWAYSVSQPACKELMQQLKESFELQAASVE